MITSLTPNLDGHLYAETEDEHRKKTRYPIVLFAAIIDSDRTSGIVPFIIKDGKLAAASGKLVRDE